MKLKDLNIKFVDGLKDLYPKEEIGSFFNLLSEYYLSFSRFQVSQNSNFELTSSTSNKFNDAENRLKNFEPIQYILGETEFYGLKFNVNKHTLIPRPETEELVEWILNISNQKKINLPISDNNLPTLLDIGTGSGCIAISLAKNLPNYNVSALDISEEALTIARNNAQLNIVEIGFFQTDILKTKSLPRQFDIIVSNPPYVRELEKELMQKNVLDFEPSTALFVENENPLVFYSAISQLAKTHLKPNGILFFEINEYLGKDLIELLKTEGFRKIEIKKDIYGKDRMLKCSAN